MNGALTSLAALRLTARQPLQLDHGRPFTAKRNLHEAIIGAPAAEVAGAMARVLADPDRRFGPLRLKRVAERVGAEFREGERFVGCFTLEGLLDRWLPMGTPRPLRVAATWLARTGLGTLFEDTCLGDYAEVTSLRMPDGGDPGAASPFWVQYRYLSGSPIAGRSTYRIVPIAADRCRFEACFEFQELGLSAMLLLHLVGVRAHDEVVASQIRQTADLLGAPILSTTLLYPAPAPG